MEIVIWVVHIVAAAILVGLIMLQQGKGADVGAAFGSGSSNTVFGARGAANFLSRTTAVLAVIFFVTSLSLAYFVTSKPKHESVTDRATGSQQDAEAQSKAATEQELVNQLSQQLQKGDAQPASPTAPAAPAPEAPKP